MRLIQTLLLTAAVAASAALAHTDEYLDTQKAPNGGQLRMAGVWHFELLAKDGEAVTVFVTDHAGTKISTAGATGTATILSGKDRTTVTLKSDGDNRLKGVGKYASTPDMKVVVSIALPGKVAEQARFTPLKALAIEANSHKMDRMQH
ncbi:MAG: hypothetical protein OHM77_08905 [Candidatus Nitricoxidivorans perseverans]|uniref:Lipocalin-like domain-containing protein n=1 Tax=Candidatus Nitricoxidivorans perseverans TaxID=2975601 RepID=A0AA49FJI5_9PROT|nr:MAG: hypothetical protein OHM77_08905 [Candidatus Nitricoxidivorans perseverans]